MARHTYCTDPREVGLHVEGGGGKVLTGAWAPVREGVPFLRKPEVSFIMLAVIVLAWGGEGPFFKPPLDYVKGAKASTP